MSAMGTVAAEGEQATASPVRGTACSAGCVHMREELAAPVLPAAQARWAAQPLADRLQVIRGARHRLAAEAQVLAGALSPDLHRTEADTLVTEVLPLLEAMRFLQREARRVLRTRRLGTRGRPLWLFGVASEVQRVPLGHVLVIGPSNFPLFLPGVQAMQALVAGNAVTWKPGVGGKRVALLVARALLGSGLPAGVLSVTEETVEAAQDALAQVPDKVIFTGSHPSGAAVLRTLAEGTIPAVMELSGTDAVAVLPSADLAQVARAVAFGLRLNGGEVCMSPRRLVGTPETLRALEPLLQAELSGVAPVALRPRTAALLRELLADAEAAGATVHGTFDAEAQRPLWLTGVRPEMAIARSDIFAPVLSFLEAPSILHLPEIINDCPYALSAAVFGPAAEARALGEQLRVGTVLVNDIIAPTADPRVPFAGRGRSGFGATRGAEGLLEMTAPKTVLVRQRPAMARQYQPLSAKEAPVFTALIAGLHGGSLREQVAGWVSLAKAGRQG